MKYNINQSVKVIETGKIVKIIDVEKFDNLILYYTDDSSAYPEDKLIIESSKKSNLSVESYVVDSFIKTMEEEVENFSKSYSDEKALLYLEKLKNKFKSTD